MSVAGDKGHFHNAVGGVPEPCLSIVVLLRTLALFTTKKKTTTTTKIATLHGKTPSILEPCLGQRIGCNQTAINCSIRIKSINKSKMWITGDTADMHVQSTKRSFVQLWT